MISRYLDMTPLVTLLLTADQHQDIGRPLTPGSDCSTPAWPTPTRVPNPHLSLSLWQRTRRRFQDSVASWLSPSQALLHSHFLSLSTDVSYWCIVKYFSCHPVIKSATAGPCLVSIFLDMLENSNNRQWWHTCVSKKKEFILSYLILFEKSH